MRLPLRNPLLKLRHKKSLLRSKNEVQNVSFGLFFVQKVQKFCLYAKIVVSLQPEKTMSDTSAHIGAWGRWSLVVVLLMTKSYVFDVLVAQPEHIEWLTADFLVTGAAAAILALLVTFTPRRYPIFILLGLTDCWMIANLLFYRSYRLFITWYQFSLIGNMEGFWSSILPYCTLSLLLFPALSLPALLCFLWPVKRFRWWESISVLLLGAILSISGAHSRYELERPELGDVPFTAEWLNPCDLPEVLSAPVWESERQTAKYIHYHSILSYPLFIVRDVVHSYLLRSDDQWTEEEQQELNRLIGPVVPQEPVPGNLLIVLLESFESWLLDSYDAEGQPICGALKNYIATHNVLFVEDVETQIQYGMSGDGQLIINTGLYPVMEGVACIDYAHNTYPNLAHFYPNSAVVNPCKNVWNQRTISAAYGYRHLIEPKGDNMFEWNDSIVMDQIIDYFNATPAPCCVMGITVSGHMPFDLHPDDVAVPDTMPVLFQHYLQTAHFTDRQLGRLLGWADTASVMQNATIVITGDHRIFHAWINDEIREYGLRANLPFGVCYAGCPFIIAGPEIHARTLPHAQQVDIFTTTLHAIGQSNYFWQGTGHNLLEDYTVSASEGNLRRQISDKLIRTDYFGQIE